MENLIGVKWGMLSKDTKDWLLENANCIDGITGNNTDDGDCIIDLTDELSVGGSIIDNEIVIDDEEIIYDTCNGVIEAKENVDFEINNVLTVSESAEIWGLTEGAVRKAISSRRFILGIDYRKAGRITLITKKAMERVYGKLD